MQLPLPRPPQDLCLLRLSAIGDVTHAVVLVRTIQRQWPETRITWVIGKLEAQLVGDIPGVEFVVFDKGRGLRGFWDLRRAMRGRRFDVLLHMQVALRANLASALIPATIRLGYDRTRSRDIHGAFITHRIPSIHGQHVLDLFRTFGQALGLQAEPPRWDIPVSEEDQRFARQWIPDNTPTLLISPCSSHRLRNWRPENYAIVADHAIRRHGLRVILCGGPGNIEREYGDAILQHMLATPEDLIGRDTLKRMLALLQRASVLIAPDSGPMHMAAATGTPVIGLHAASNPRRSGPYHSLRWCVDKYDQAARVHKGCPAAELRWGTKLEYPGVMDLIRPEEVCDRLDEFMREQARGKPQRGTP